jgi:hypothetical protein
MGNSAYLCRGKEVIAVARACIPRMWLAAFRPTDVHDGEPTCNARKALERLDYLGIEGARMLAEAIRGAPKGRDLRIECDEIAELWTRESAFIATLKRALGGDSRATTKLAGMEVLGASHIRDVPWEKKKKPRERKAPPGKALRDALDARDWKGARALLRQGADPNYADAFGTCWGSAPASMIGELVAAGGDLNLKQRRHGPPLVYAAWRTDIAKVRAMLALGANVHLTDVFGRPAIAIAARRNDVAMTTVLLAAKPSVKDLQIARREATKKGAAQTLALLDKV